MFLFLLRLWMLYIRIHYQIQHYKIYLFKNFILPALKCMLPPLLVFIHGERIHIHSFACVHPVVPAPCVKDTVSSTCSDLDILWRKKSCDYLFHWSICLFIFMSRKCTALSRLLCSKKIKKCCSSSFFLLFQHCFGNYT